MDRTGLMRWVPGVRTLLRYEAGWFRHDLVAGLMVATSLVPIGVAYADASGMPGITGLYATIVPLVAYAVFGPSRIFVLGPDAALSAMILVVVAPISGGDPQRAISVGAAMALVVGIACLAAGLLRLGFITELLSKPIRHGYMNGIALAIFLTQTPKLLGFSVTASGPLRQLVAIADRVWAGGINPVALALGGGTLALILVLKRWPRIPGMLVAVVAATLAVSAFDLATRAGLSVLGPLPQGLPLPRVPLPPLESLSAILTGGLAIALLSFADTSVLSRTYAARLRTPVDPNQELVGLGLANAAAGFFQGFPISSSSTRTAVAHAAGGKTQLTGIVGAAVIVALLVFAPALLQDLPDAALAAVMFASAISLIEVKDLVRIYRIQRWEFWLSMTCFAGVAVLGALPGIVLAIAIAVVEFLWRAWRPHSAVLGEVEHVRGYHDISRYPNARLIPGLVLFRWDAPLFFANAEFFHRRVLAAVASSPTPVRWLVVAAEPVTSIDVTAADAVCELDDALNAAGIRLCFAELKDPAKDTLKRFGLMNRFGERPFFATIGEAVSAYSSLGAAKISV